MTFIVVKDQPQNRSLPKPSLQSQSNRRLLTSVRRFDRQDPPQTK